MWCGFSPLQIHVYKPLIKSFCMSTTMRPGLGLWTTSNHLSNRFSSTHTHHRVTYSIYRGGKGVNTIRRVQVMVVDHLQPPLQQVLVYTHHRVTYSIYSIEEGKGGNSCVQAMEGLAPTQSCNAIFGSCCELQEWGKACALFLQGLF
jgi:hypothetical protein